MNQFLEAERDIFLTDFGYSADHTFLPDIEQREPLSFKQFHPFISLEGLDFNTTTSFLSFLQDLFEGTPEHLWFPESCCGAVEIARNARMISPSYFPEQTKINVFMERNHLWSVARLQNQIELIIDPAGILDPELEAVLPYFGILETCSFDGYPLMYARQVYNGGEILTSDQEKTLLRYQEILLHGI